MFNKAIKLFALALAVSVATMSGAWAGEYTGKSYHSSDGTHTYKHPKQRSFTSPFDYGPKSDVITPAPAPTGRCNCFTFDATKSHDIDGQKLSIVWDFGDGQTSEQPIVQHCFDKAGDFNVNLTVKDSSGMTCDTGVNTVKVSPNYPPTANAGPEVKACLGEAVTFDGSASTTSSPSKFTWDFGDGTTGEGEKVTHTYEKPGSYKVLLLIDDGKGTACSTARAGTGAWIAERPTVGIEGPDATCTGRTVSFHANATGGSLKYHWDFGDGTTWDGGSAASHAYQKGGTYNVLVTVDNGQGFACSTASAGKQIKINSTPIADAGENLACCVGQTTVLDGSKSSDPDGDQLSYHWDFGDGASSDEMKTTHVYEKSGTYRVVLTVKDSSGSDCGMSMDSYVANVNTKPEAVIEVR